ncbi:bone morphogenetic protein 8B isoform X2 [Lutra lutra]|uniref:bone morphogenetic protein 8B isoform X2 n=1 Tax=Lutra lutra TaxID=9657 RepID=UPI001FD2FC3C|nr:bone morphogenetic protein 8B isoform X2 [Lutra lutra]
MAARPGPLWLVGLALCALSGGGPGPRPPAGCPVRRLGPRERRDMQREILAVLGLPGRPRPRAPPAAARVPASAPLFMLDLYHAMADDDDEDGGPPEWPPGRADLVMSFVNMVERDRTLGYQEPHWKEFRFDLTQIPEGEAVTAAEFRIYKLASAHLLNRTLHVSVFQVVREQSNRESDLLFLDLQTLRAGDEGWLVLDVTAASDRWLLSRNKDLALRLYVETDDGAPDEARCSPQGVLRPHQAERHLRALLRQQQQCHPAQAPQHGGPGLRLPLRPVPAMGGPHPGQAPLQSQETLKPSQTSGGLALTDQYICAPLSFLPGLDLFQARLPPSLPEVCDSLLASRPGGLSHQAGSLPAAASKSRCCPTFCIWNRSLRTYSCPLLAQASGNMG